MSDPLDDLLSDIRACRVCRDAPEGVQLPHEPLPVVRARNGARLVIAGQAPMPSFCGAVVLAYQSVASRTKTSYQPFQW